MEDLFNVQQVAEKLQIHLMTVYKLISSGRLQAKRVPGIGLRIEATEIERLLCGRSRMSRRKRTNAKPRR